MQFYLKARFHFNKDQFAELLLISAIAGAISQVPSIVWLCTSELKIGRVLDFYFLILI